MAILLLLSLDRSLLTVSADKAYLVVLCHCRFYQLINPSPGKVAWCLPGVHMHLVASHSNVTCIRWMG